ncbi:MAG: ATP-binding cassette domain-containing protein [Planctomycetota bacterium]|nr:ATP-binding cassette domain-containing protein [Planctomycetota bacterium]
MAVRETILEMEGIRKAFGSIRALNGVDFEVRAGEVHALIGENGAGKSALMNVLAGRFDDYEGRVVIGGREVRLTNPRRALKLGVAVIYQELSVLPNLSVGENIMLGQEPAGRFPGAQGQAWTGGIECSEPDAARGVRGGVVRSARGGDTGACGAGGIGADRNRAGDPGRGAGGRRV